MELVRYYNLVTEHCTVELALEMIASPSQTRLTHGEQTIENCLKFLSKTLQCRILLRIYV
jgi:hypothetical protein